MSRIKAVLDIECFFGYFLIGIKSLANGKVATFERSDWTDFDVDSLKSLLIKYTIVTFNGNRYDVPMLKGAIAGFNPAKLKALSDDIIVNDLRSWDAELKYSLPKCYYLDHIDLIEVAPGKVSLKIYGGRLHSKRMQDLPIEPSAVILESDRNLLCTYNVNDLDTTIDLYKRLTGPIELREQMSKEYGLDLRSKSDAQIAEAVIKKQIEAIKSEKIFKPDLPKDFSFNYVPPGFVKFTAPDLVHVLNVFQTSKFTLNEKGDVAEPSEVSKLGVKIGNSKYKLGIGGIHSCEKKVHYVADSDHVLVDRDVTSYYPNIILSQRLYPKHIGPDFLTVYRSIVEKRVEAKRMQQKLEMQLKELQCMKKIEIDKLKSELKQWQFKNEGFKIQINSSFGKFGSKWSALYGPNLLIQTTVTGQLSLLMLIEALESAGVSVVSANTDGIVIYCHKRNQAAMYAVIKQWELVTGFNTEETEYSAIYSRDINNYIAFKASGSYKAKGTYADAELSKTPTVQVCVQAAIDCLQLGIPVETTIRSCVNIAQFISVRSVTGGAVKDGVYLGKAVRWYYAVGETGAIHYKKNGNKVAMTDQAKPLMLLPDTLPKDIDYPWYIAKAYSILADLGCHKHGS